MSGEPFFRVSVTRVVTESCEIRVYASSVGGSPDKAEEVAKELADGGKLAYTHRKAECIAVAPPLPEEEKPT